MHDVAVIGDGVAGLAAVRALQQAGHAPVLIAPARAHFGNRGELLGPRALATLTTLDWRHLLDDERLALPVTARYSAWGSPALIQQALDPDLGAGWHVDRRALEMEMETSIAACRLHRIDASVRGVERQEGSWRLALSPGEEVRARFVIDCSGRGATVARRLGGHRYHDDRLVAMHRMLTLSEASVMLASLVESTPNGWWYTTTMPGQGQLFAAFFTDADLLNANRGDPRAELLTGAPYTKARLESLGAVAMDAPWQTVVASTARQEFVSGDGWTTAGDAAVALDPLAGHGLTVALWSAVQAAAAADAWLDGDDAPLQTYQQAVTAGMVRFASELARRYRAERRFHDQAFWVRRRRTESK